MESSAQVPARRSSGEWLFQLTTITVGVLIALSFDAVLRWNSNRQLVAEATATISREIADNRGHVDRQVYLANGEPTTQDAQAARALIIDLRGRLFLRSSSRQIAERYATFQAGSEQPATSP
jgi:hypothetical protein